MPGQGRKGPRGLVRHAAHKPRTWMRPALDREIARLACRGFTSTQIANAMGLAFGTIENSLVRSGLKVRG